MQLPMVTSRGPTPTAPAAVNVVLVRPLINVQRNSPFFLPLGLLCIASPVRAAGHRVEVIDYEFLYRDGRFEPKDPEWIESLCEPILAAEPRVIGLTALADTLPHCLLMGRFLKRRAPEVTVVLGGPGVFGSFPEVIERFAGCVDYVCSGEGELAFLELVNRLAAGEHAPQVAGMQAAVCGCGEDFGRQPFAALDDLPMPAYDLLSVSDYLRLASPRIFDVYVGSGCTYSCRFCVTAPFWDRSFRAKSPSVVLRELSFLHERYGITQFNFLHDNFANNKTYLDSFIDHFLAHNTLFEWGCAVRPDNVTRDQIARMRRAGCFRLFCGTDAGSAKILRAMAKMPNSGRSYRFFGDCQATGMGFETNTIIGYPDESDEDLEKAIEVIFDSVAYGSHSSDASVLQPLPGAEVTKENLGSLVFVDSQQFGTFLPPEVKDLARENAALFPGFSFIRKKNHPHPWYVRVVEFVRHFTRHWFRTVYFLKNRGGVGYVSLFSRLSGEAGPSEFGARLGDVVRGLELADSDLVRSVFEYDTAEERVKGADVSREVENIYSEAAVAPQSLPYALIDLPHSVHLMFEAMPTLTLPAEVFQPKSYLFFRDRAGAVATIVLHPWQRRLWGELDLGARPSAVGLDDTVESFARRLADSRSEMPDRVKAAVARTVELFQRVVNPTAYQVVLR